MNYDELGYVDRALRLLYNEQPIWRKNLVMWSGLDMNQRYYWWERMKKQAEGGAPAAQTLLLKVIALRML